MKKYRVIFYIIFFFFHVALFGFSLYVDLQKNDFGTLTELYKHVGVMKYGTFFGLILVSVDFVMDKIEIGKLDKKILQMQNETNSWKAKLYDLQSDVKESASSDTSSETDSSVQPDDPTGTN